jgi:S1-C subfamily serine protease
MLLHRRSAAVLARLLTASVAAAWLTACAASGPPPDGARVEPPAALSYPYPIAKGLDFPDYREVAARQSGIYVRVRVYSDAPEDVGNGRDDPTASNALSFASGIVADARGYVVTAAHVANATKYKAEVITLDGRRFQGRVVAVERARELGLIKIDPFPGMAVARFAGKETLAVGQPVLAIGTPRHHGGVVSVGAVLRPRVKTRIAYADYGYDHAIALALRIESGNSGGPVLDREGRVIGMIASNYSAEIGLAVPAADIERFLRAHAGG